MAHPRSALAELVMLAFDSSAACQSAQQCSRIVLKIQEPLSHAWSKLKLSNHVLCSPNLVQGTPDLSGQKPNTPLSLPTALTFTSRIISISLYLYIQIPSKNVLGKTLLPSQSLKTRGPASPLHLR